MPKLSATCASLAIALLAACDDDLQPTPDPSNGEVGEPHQAREVVELIRDEWARRLDTELPDDVPTIRWFDGPCLVYPPEFTRPEWRDGCILGRFFGDADDVHVGWMYSYWHSDSSLSHELLHWSLSEALGDSDSEHRSRYWDEVSDVNLVVRDLEWGL
jgi:hypothetical protein